MIGKILGGRYEIIEQIGGGGMALVYKAKCQLLDRFVAIKILKDEFVNDEEFVRKFRRESQAAASLSHPNIVNIYDVGYEEEDNNQIYYIVMEYIKGKSLKDIIKSQGKLLLDTSLDYTLQIAEALQHAHKNHIVHRDIKPHNIMITEDNRVKVTDFGIARAATTSTVTAKSDVLGSVHYFSPEQARGGYTDEKSDIYSLGIVMYEMVTGKLPYDGDSPIIVALKHVQEDIVPPREVDGLIPVWFENIILKAVEKRQADRYANITELIVSIQKYRTKEKNIIIDNQDDFQNHTKLIPVVNVKDENTMKNNKNMKNNKKTKKDNNLRNIILIILLGFLTALIMYAGYHKVKDFFTTEEVYVISVVGLQEEAAREAIEDLGLRFSVKARVKDSAPAGQVISQEIVDTKVKLNFPIEVTISDGDNLKDVPSIINKDLDYGRQLLEAADLKMGNPTYEYSKDIPEDVIISQDPEAGTSVEPGTRINVVVSQGEEIKYTNMTQLVGLTIGKAKDEIERLDLVVGEVFSEANDEVEKDIVFWQSFEVGTELETKTVVDLYISSGPSEETGVGNGDNEVEEKQIVIRITPLPDEEETTIVINRRQDGVTKEVYNKKHSSSEIEINILLSGKIGSEFDIYKNGIYQLTMPMED